MELKQMSHDHNSFPGKVLIVPSGIETWSVQSIYYTGSVLIVPSGIETAYKLHCEELKKGY